MKKPFDNQYATQRLLSEESATGGGVTNGASFTAGSGEQYSTTKAFKNKKVNEKAKDKKDVEPKIVAGKASIYPVKKWGWKNAPSIPNRPSKGGFQYKQMFEEVEEGVLQPVNLDKDSLSPMEYQQAQSYQEFNQDDWTFDDVSKRYIKKQAEADKEMQTENDAEKPYYVKVSVRDAKRALDVLRDNPSYRGVELNGSDTYYTDDEDLAYDMMMDFGTQDIEVIDDNFSDSHLYGSEDLNEALTYNKFKREAATRPNKDALHEALKSINKKLHEINKLMEYSTNMRMELEEDYSPRTGKVVNKLERQLAEIYKKVKSLK